MTQHDRSKPAWENDYTFNLEISDYIKEEL